ncbi:TPA: stage V sporulation protein AD [bacterium]|jgi:stage V sporulation protein AD|nr:stage V sporulation protein AD [bacterium]
MSSARLNNTYVQGTFTVVGPMEMDGPIGSYFDAGYKDLYCGEKSFEKAEQMMVKRAIKGVIDKCNLTEADIGMAFGGDLCNQITAASFSMRDFKIPFAGVFGACSTSMLSLALASTFVESNQTKYALAFTSSHNATAERQFRFPTEYGAQKPPCTTYTVTGAGSCIVSSIPSDIKITGITFGEVVDLEHKDINDLGSAMAPAALKCLQLHLEAFNIEPSYYDMIVTGDLSKVGRAVLLDMAKEYGIELNNHYDCGLIVYDINKQKVFSGGSGCACSAVTTYSYLFHLLETRKIKKLLVMATGALMSPTTFQQKDSIPCVAHAVAFEVM